MARITHKITKPIDRNAPPKASSARAQRAMHGRKLPRAAPAAPAGPVPAPAEPPAPVPTAIARTSPTSAKPNERRRKPPKPADRRADARATGSRRAAPPSPPPAPSPSPWRIGPPSLGKDAIELSVGSQQYAVGSQFLFGNGGSDGGKRGGYWLGLRRASELAGIARLKTGEFFGETVYFRTDDLGGDHTNGVGANFDYDFGKLLDIEQMKLGLGYWNLFNSDNKRRDGLNVVNVRLDTIPVEALPGLGLSSEFVKEKNEAKNDSWAITGQLAYDFAANDVCFRSQPA